MKSCSIPLIIREMQIKTTVSYYLKPVRMVIIKNSHMKLRQKEKDKYHMIITYLESNVQYKWTYLQKRNKLTDIEKRLVVAKGKGEGVGWTRCLGLVDANYCLRNGQAMRSCCIAQRTISNHLWWKNMKDNLRKINVCVCVCVCVTVSLCYS